MLHFSLYGQQGLEYDVSWFHCSDKLWMWKFIEEDMEEKLPVESPAPLAHFIHMPITAPNSAFKSLIKTVHSRHRRESNRGHRCCAC